MNPLDVLAIDHRLLLNRDERLLLSEASTFFGGQATPAAVTARGRSLGTL